MPTTFEVLKHPPARPPKQFLTHGSSRREGSSGSPHRPRFYCRGLQWWLIGRSVLNFISFVCYTLQRAVMLGGKNSSLLAWSILLQWNLLEKDGQACVFKLEQEEDLCSLKAARAQSAIIYNSVLLRTLPHCINQGVVRRKMSVCPLCTRSFLFQSRFHLNLIEFVTMQSWRADCHKCGYF